jgi:predicted nucleic acid-binding protein
MSKTPPRKKAVYDTGVVLRAALSDRGPSFTALRLLEEGRVIVVFSRYRYQVSGRTLLMN